MMRHGGFTLKPTKRKTVLHSLSKEERARWCARARSIGKQPTIIIQQSVDNGGGYRVFHGLVYPDSVIILHAAHRFYVKRPDRNIFHFLLFIINHYNLHTYKEYTLHEQSHNNWYTLCKDIVS